MPTRYYVTKDGTLNGSQILPVTNPDITYTSVSMGANSARVDCYIEFYDTNGNQVTPTGGQVHFYGTPMSKGWLEAQGSPVNAADVGAINSSYTPPYMDGLVMLSRVRFVGITGAASASVIFYKREGA